MKRSATAQWRGNIRQGEGTVNTESGVVKNIPYSFGKRFGEDKGSNPEEFIAAAHSSCFAMALSGELEKVKLKPESIDVTATVSLEQGVNGWTISTIHLDVTADIPGASYNQAEEAAQSARLNCPISKLFKANITMEFNLTSQEANAIQ